MPKREVVEAKALYLLSLRSGQRHDLAHNGHPGGDDSQMRGQARTKPAARRQPDRLQCLVQAGGHLRPWRHQVGNPFSEDLAHAGNGLTKEFARMQDQLNALSRTGQVFDHSTISAVQAGGWLLTERAQRTRRGRGDMEHELIFVPFHCCLSRAIIIQPRSMA